MGHFTDVLILHIAAKGNIQLHQVLVNRPRLLPLFEYDYSYFVSQPWAEIILQPLLHAADSEIINPTSQHLIQLRECIA